MPKVPQADQAQIDPRKVAGYLLDAAHPVGGPKAAFLASFGFRADDPGALIMALLDHVRTYDATALPSTPHGAKYVVIGALRSPDGTNPSVRTVWIIDVGGSVPRFVTAVPA